MIVHLPPTPTLPRACPTALPTVDLPAVALSVTHYLRCIHLPGLIYSYGYLRCVTVDLRRVVALPTFAFAFARALPSPRSTCTGSLHARCRIDLPAAVGFSSYLAPGLLFWLVRVYATAVLLPRSWICRLPLCWISSPLQTRLRSRTSSRTFRTAAAHTVCCYAVLVACLPATRAAATGSTHSFVVLPRCAATAHTVLAAPHCHRYPTPPLRILDCRLPALRRVSPAVASFLDQFTRWVAAHAHTFLHCRYTPARCHTGVFGLFHFGCRIHYLVRSPTPAVLCLPAHAVARPYRVLPSIQRACTYRFIFALPPATPPAPDRSVHTAFARVPPPACCPPGLRIAYPTTPTTVPGLVHTARFMRLLRLF